MHAPGCEARALILPLEGSDATREGRGEGADTGMT